MLLLSIRSFSQELLKGEIANSGDVAGIHVFNKTHSKYTITDEYGKFKIAVQLNDTIVFSAIQYELKEIVVTKKVLQSYQYVLLKTKINELDVVYIMPKLSGNLRLDSKAIKTRELIAFKTTKSFKGVGATLGNLPVDNQSKVTNEALGTSFHGVDIIALIKYFIPKKKLNHHQPILKMNRSQLHSYFGDTFFERGLDLIKDDVERFIHFTENDTIVVKALKNGNKMLLLERLMWLRKDYKTTD